MPHLSVPASATSAAVLHLYRRIIKNAKVFPSKGRDRMLKEIREEFRLNAKESDPEKVKHHRSMAIQGLSQLQAYTGLEDSDMDWSVTMEQAPLGGLSEEKVEEKLRRVPQMAMTSGKDVADETGQENDDRRK
ncbi:hypothetical protein NGA_0419902 [Nannochloropsis gaditana CCMP526]|uniref:uncharacterized protein n=1 Tax=Nannochloropsis gaditana (strain CCMP526) TaxID=1093141 RepID=UPI00029F7500|nr:hypothetical protein NGA_0419902 [Nannochloropsis gaditana CCMP526]EKU22357.1 hypothetical protein NGA_0419902 [Nannochloropsis gaditana CCMP526]|eukprot:XP_005854002.1 hypothetical protein NGA_0419902 [Nannochloropsis gaditana CCMP526]